MCLQNYESLSNLFYLTMPNIHMFKVNLHLKSNTTKIRILDPNKENKYIQQNIYNVLRAIFSSFNYSFAQGVNLSCINLVTWLKLRSDRCILTCSLFLFEKKYF